MSWCGTSCCYHRHQEDLWLYGSGNNHSTTLLLPLTLCSSFSLYPSYFLLLPLSIPQYSVLLLLSLSLILCSLPSLSIPHTLCSSFALYPSFSVLFLLSLSLLLYYLLFLLSISLLLYCRLFLLSLSLFICTLPSLSIPLRLFSSPSF